MTVSGNISVTRAAGSLREIYGGTAIEMGELHRQYLGCRRQRHAPSADPVQPGRILQRKAQSGNAGRNSNLFVSGTNNTYAGGTVIDDCGNGALRGAAAGQTSNQPQSPNAIQVGGSTQLGTGNVTMEPGSWMYLSNAGAVAPGRSILLQGNGNLPAVLEPGVFSPISIINPASNNFVIGIYDGQNNGASMNLSGFA